MAVPAVDPQPTPGPLDGLRIVDLTTVIMGPYAAAILGDLGADVIKVEEPAGDMARGIGPRRHPGMSGLALNLNRNKRSVAVNLKAPEGRAVLADLVRGADAVLTNLRPASRERLGLTYEGLAAVNPGVVLCTAQAFRTGSDVENLAAYDDIVQARSGLTSLYQRAGGEQGYAPFVVADKVCGLTVVYSLLAALLHRQRTGEGQWVDVPMVDTMIAFNLVEHLNGHTFEPPEGGFGWSRVLTANRRPQRTADGWVCLLPYSDRNWRDFFDHIGRPELGDDPRFGSIDGRHANMAELLDLVAEAATGRTTAEWLEFCARVSIPATPVVDLEDVPDDPYVREGGLVTTATHPSEGRYRTVSTPARFSRTPGRLRRHAPRLGADTRDVLAEAGHTVERIDSLLAAGVAYADGPTGTAAGGPAPIGMSR
ncbi:CoA transferase [Pseudonocardia sp. H11422]|uniref:CaiB/BaiF CoA transferase family protein n=1 Tax=Pseudonocardia sp. H11422 TaxID=2835866 RepID=UPI0027E2A03B|nr:CoA transferase [Pseudonocardia sp. H11422]